MNSNMNATTSCPLCNYLVQAPTSKIYVNSSYTSLFPLFPSPEFKYSPSSCPSCGVSILINDISTPILGLLNPTVTYKEPIDHIPSISLKLSNLISQTPFNLVSTGPKNNLLIHSIIDLNPSCTTSNSYDLTPPPRSNTPNILFLTRIIEHINSYSLLNTLLSSCADGDIIYLEILDFATLYSLGNLSFFWNERITYPSKQYLLDYFARRHFYPFCLQSIIADEPFHFFVLIKQSTSSTTSSLIMQSTPRSSFNINTICNLIRDRMSRIATSFKSISFYGIGHKSLTLVDFILQSNPDANILLYDGSLAKVSRYYKDICIQELNLDNISSPSHSLHVFSFNGIFADILRNHIRGHVPNCSFATIDYLMHFSDEYQKD